LFFFELNGFPTTSNVVELLVHLFPLAFFFFLFSSSEVIELLVILVTLIHEHRTVLVINHLREDSIVCTLHPDAVLLAMNMY
jgi:hypothetical protein